MPIETEDFLPFLQWFPSALAYWGAVIGCLVVAALAFGWLIAALRHGPGQAVALAGHAMIETALDLAQISPRRVLALTWLAVKEAIRRRVVVVFVVFMLIPLFAGWFIKQGSDQPARLYLDYVVFPWSTYLTLLFALLLSALSLPGDIKSHTLHTVVTKPVRKSEVVLGRILGFTVIGTALLGAMGIISYIFTVRGLAHTHSLTAANLRDDPAQPGAKKGLTGFGHHHQHEVTVDADGEATIESAQGHWHEVTREGADDKTVYKLGPPQGLLLARVPVYGKLRFLDRSGKDAEKGVNVGDEWTYRSFIEGGSRATAIWTFSGLRPAMFPETMFPDAIPLEMTIEVFRTYKGDVAKGVLGGLWLRNPKTEQTVEVRNFLAKKFATDVQWIPRTIETPKKDSQGNTVKDEQGKTVMEQIDLFRDLVSDDGQLEVWIQCLERSQYFGMAQADVYFRARDASFLANFAKGYVGIWMQMVLVIGFGVMFSTFLSAPVALIATLGAVLGGIFSDFMSQLAAGKVIGGGPFEAFIRIINQQNLVTPLEPGLQKNVAEASDIVAQCILWVLSSVLPALGNFDFSDHVAYGFDVGWDMLLKCLCRTAAFLVPVFVAGYFFLKTREVAR